MRAGKLDRVITIERATAGASDSYGVPSSTWATLATLRAQIVQASTEEFVRAFGDSTETAVIFRTRYLDGVTLADRVAYEGAVHNLVEVKEIGRRRGLELRTRRVGP